MSFTALLPFGSTDDLVKRAVDAIREHRAASSDPGLCVAELPFDRNDRFKRQMERLMAFGSKAKEAVCTKDEAYALAADIPWLRLSEHGGTGDGVIGALAGAGLRLGGDDGRFRGKWDLRALLRSIDPSCDVPSVAVGNFCRLLASRTAGSVQVVDIEGNPVDPEVRFVLEKDAKPVMRGGALTIVVRMREGRAYPCSKEGLGEQGSDGARKSGCGGFAFDNDLEECSTKMVRGCRNCLYRRWTPFGFACMHRARDPMRGGGGLSVGA